MKKYIIIRLIFNDEILAELHDLMLKEYERLSREITDYAATLGADVFFSDACSTTVCGRSYAEVEYNFPMSSEDKLGLIEYLRGFFVDGEVVGDTMDTHNAITAVRFLKTDGELF